MRSLTFWCESCAASRSREDNFASSGDPGRREYPTISMDWMFTSTSEGPLATHLIAVDSQTKFVIAVPVETKGGKSLSYATEEIVRFASSVGHSRVALRYDTEPAMIQLAKSVMDARLRMGLSTSLEPVAPDTAAHGALRAERYIHSVRQLGTCLLKTVEQHTGHKTESTEPLFCWAYRHAAFLISRFAVHDDGCTSFELLHGRLYDAKLCPFGSLVYAQVMPKPKQKGEPWRPCVWLGRSTLGNLNIVGDSAGIHVARSVRRAPREYDTTLIKAMRGVPWDHTLGVLGVKKEKRQRFRLPVVLETTEAPVDQGPGDEAASDPPSNISLPGAGGSEMSVSGSLGISTSSDELMPDPSTSTPPPASSSGNQASRVEGDVQLEENGVIRRAWNAEEEFPTGHEETYDPAEFGDEELMAALEVDYSVDEILDEAARREFEAGPPELSEEDLAALDARMDQVEYNRLLEMDVLRPVNLKDVGGMTRLSCKHVRDWRYRQGGWQRRSRLVAREFRFLEPGMEGLYSPASVGTVQRLFAALACSNPRLKLYSADIKDAYLTVAQVRPTYVVMETGSAFELRYMLPGQRAGSRGWYDKLKGVLESNLLEAFPASPALFIQPKVLGVSTHVDDLQVLGEEPRVQQLFKTIKDAGLKMEVEGPCTPEFGVTHYLKRKYEGIGNGILISHNNKHVDKLIAILKLEQATPKHSPLPASLKSQDDEPLSAERHATFRTCVGILMYLGQDRPEAMYAIKQLTCSVASPTGHDWKLLEHLVRFLKGAPSRGILMVKTVPGRSFLQRAHGESGTEDVPKGDNPFSGGAQGHFIEAVSDASWGSERDRRSMSCMTLYVNGNMLMFGNRKQKSYALSSCEAELYASLGALQEGLFVKRIIEKLVGENVRLKLLTDASSLRALIEREGLRALKHVDLSYLWIQAHRRSKTFDCAAVSSKWCVADLGTKSLSASRIKFLCCLLGVCEVTGELIGKAELEDELFREGLRRVQLKSSKGRSKLLLPLLLAQLREAEGALFTLPWLHRPRALLEMSPKFDPQATSWSFEVLVPASPRLMAGTLPGSRLPWIVEKSQQGLQSIEFILRRVSNIFHFCRKAVKIVVETKVETPRLGREGTKDSVEVVSAPMLRISSASSTSPPTTSSVGGTGSSSSRMTQAFYFAPRRGRVFHVRWCPNLKCAKEIAEYTVAEHRKRGLRACGICGPVLSEGFD